MPYVKGVRGAVAEDLSGRAFGRFVVLERDASRTSRPFWLCKCECGAVKSVAAVELKAGKTKSCGCFDADRKKTATVKHGFNRTPTYVSWCAMWARCTNPKLRSFKHYGGRGITVCVRWADFSAFLVDMGERPANTSIDRIDVNGNYEPDNCRWATASTQRRNQRAAAEIGRSMP
jgi:hypothetical protein